MSQSVTRLKQILFDAESQRLEDVARRVQGVADTQARQSQEIGRRLNDLSQRVGSEEAFRHSVAEVLDGAVRQAEVSRPDAMNAALAPLVIGTMRHELKNSQQEMVDMLAPITGQLVKTYVTNAFKDLMEQINRRLEVGMPGKGLALRVRSIITGQPLSELALAETQILVVEELYLLKRGSGEVVEYWSAGEVGGGPSSNRTQLTGGMLAALTSYAEEAFEAQSAGLKVLEFADDADAIDQRIYVRGSPARLLAVKLSGSGPTAIRQLIDDQFYATLQAHHAIEGDRRKAPAVLPGLAATLTDSIAGQLAELRPSGGFGPLYALLALILVPVVGWGGWSMWQALETGRTRAAAEDVLAAVPDLGRDFVRLEVDAGGRALTISGYVPTAAMRGNLVERLRLGERAIEVRDQLAVLPRVPLDNQELESRIERRLEAGVEMRLSGRIAGLQRDLVGAESARARQSIERALARAKARLQLAAPVLRQAHAGSAEPAARAQLDRLLAAIAVAERAWPALPSAAETDRTWLAGVETPLAMLRQRLGAAERDLAGLLGLTAAVPASSATTMTETAEEAAHAAERLNVLAVSYVRLASVQPIERDLAALSARVDKLSVPPPQVSDRLVAWIKAGHVIYFANGVDYREEEAARRVVFELAALVRDSAAGTIRVVGFTDELGQAASNSTLGSRRAERIVAALVEIGVPRARLQVTSRAGDADARPATGPQSPNRRVELELVVDRDGPRP